MNNSENIKILHLARWYPNRYDPMFGLFVKRHFEAVGFHLQTHLIYVHPVEALPKNHEVVVSKNGNATEIIVYYRDFSVAIPLLSQIVKAFKFVAAVRRGFSVLKENGLEYNFIHVHILTRLGVIALIINIFKKIPFGITEHWSRYLPATDGFKGILRKWLTRKVVANAKFISTVTENMHQAMLQHGLENSNYFVLPNIVNPTLVYDKSCKKNDVFSIIHISTFEDKSKNIQGIIRVISELEKDRTDFRFVFVGDGLDFQQMKSYANEKIRNSDLYQFTGLLENEQLAETLQKSHLMVIFSNYENFPVVINEALAMGIPVVATKVGGISEVINSENGLLIHVKAEQELKEAIIDFLNHKYQFDSAKIRADFLQQYSNEKISQLLLANYKT